MGEIVNLNIRGLKTENLRSEKVILVQKILSEHKTKILSLQETRINSVNEIPKQFTNFDHVYNIEICEAPNSDPGSDIIVFVKKQKK